MKKKKLLGLMSLAVCSFGLISSAQAMTLQKPDPLTGTSDVLPSGDATYTENVSDLAHYTITYDGGSYKIVAANGSIGRYEDAAWAGLQIKVPSDANTIADFKAKAVYYRGDNPTSHIFWDASDNKTASDDDVTQNYINVFVPITEEDLKNAVLNEKLITAVYKFDWDGNGSIDQTITINIDPSKKITLTEKNSNDKVWDNETYEEVKEIVENAKEEAAKTHVVFVSKEDQNGEVSVDKKTAKEGETVTITVNPAEGYKLDTLKVLFGDKEVKVELVDGKYTFEMPAGNVNVKATFAKAEVNNPENGGEENVTDSDKEEVKEETKDETESKNPSTFDGIVGYVALAVSSVGTVAVSTKKVLK